MFTIENKHTAKVLGTYEGETKEEALQAMAKEAGYQSFDKIPNNNRDDLLIYEA